MADLKVLAQIAHSSGLPEDVTVNTWAFGNVNIATATDMDDIAVELLTFYNVLAPGETELVSHYSPELTDQLLLKFYDLASPEPRAPIRTQGEVLTNMNTTGTALPSEVALCLSFQAVQISGQPQARRRGRLYLGPFVNSIDTVAVDGSPGSQLIQTMVATGQRLLDASNSATWYWGIHSPTDGEVNVVNNGWVDNAFDTQRRRGIAATVRTQFTT